MAFVELLLPILVAAVFVFVVSSVLHVAVPLHKDDFARLPDEDSVLAAMRDAGVEPGAAYSFPHAESMQAMGTPEMVEKLNRGPVGTMVLLPNGPWAMGKSLVQWFALSLVIGAFVAYLGSLALAPGAPAGEVFRVTSTAGILGYAPGRAEDSIWKGVRWSVTAKFVLGGVLYGLATGAAFAWLWPAA